MSIMMDCRYRTKAKHIGRELAEKLTVERMTPLFAELYSKFTPISPGQSAAEATEVTRKAPKRPRSQLLQSDSESSDDGQDTNAEQLRATISAELSTYLNTKPSETDPLLYWKGNRTTLPKLALCARVLFSAAPTSCQTERMFSTAGWLRRQ